MEGEKGVFRLGFCGEEMKNFFVALEERMKKMKE